jgi:hypothetical protein
MCCNRFRITTRRRTGENLPRRAIFEIGYGSSHQSLYYLLGSVLFHS